MSKNLEFSNRGNELTFVPSVRQEVLDATLLTSYLCTLNYLTGIHISNESLFSDHRYLIFEFVNRSSIVTIPKRTNWERYTRVLATALSMEQGMLLVKQDFFRPYTEQLWGPMKRLRIFAKKISNVVFIPKTGSPDHINPRYFRTICLTSFVLKGLERLVDR